MLKSLSECTQPPLSISDRFSPLHWDRPVAYPTQFYATGLGVRSLTSSELYSVFGFPVRVRSSTIPIHIFDLCIPVQLLHAILHPVLQQCSTASNKRQRRGSLSKLLPPDPTDMDVSLTCTTTVQDLHCHSRSWIPSIGRWLPHSWITPDAVTPGAAKRDDADLPIHLWNRRLQLLYPLCSDQHLDTLREFLLQKLVRRNVFKSFSQYLHTTYGSKWAFILGRDRRLQRTRGGVNVFSPILHDACQGVDVLRRLSGSTWWDWSAGSSLLFWRWGSFLPQARDGMLPYLCGPLPVFKRRSAQPDPTKLSLIATKFDTIIRRGYIAPGPILSLTQFFDVPKGAGDIRMVYNGTSCGFNRALWCPKFWLPTARSAVRLLDFNFYAVDMDLAEMFLNFPLHESLQPYSGVDLTPYKTALHITTPGPYHLRWTRTWMGARPSPFFAVRYFYIADEFVRGNHLDPRNPFYWDKIILNLPGSTNYDPSKPRVMKWNSLTNSIAADVIVYVDDLRIQGRDVETAWRLAHIIATRLQYLGIQVAIRKHRPPTRTPGAWAGAVLQTSDNSVTVSVSQDKWNKAKGIVRDLIERMNSENNNSNTLNYKLLEISRGFLVHLSMTFEILTPYLKGFHLALAEHNPQRNSEGWKLTDNEWKAYLQDKVLRGECPQAELDAWVFEKQEKKRGSRKPHDANNVYNPPFEAKIVTQLKNDLFALQTFFEGDSPPQIEVRKRNITLLLYGFADASGSGLGSTMLIPGSGIRYRVGVWGPDTEGESSNFREFENVVLTVEEEARNGTLQGSVMFLFTDNSTVEGALYKGNTPSEKLFRLVVRLRKVEFQHGATIVVSHVSGKRMIAQGTDAISRGQLNEGVAGGLPMLDFVPLHLTAFDRSPQLKPWIVSWLGNDVEFLNPADWFIRGHDLSNGFYDKSGFWRYDTKPGKYIWCPPPAAADVALEEMRKALIKRQDSTHVFLCPRLLTPEWRRQLAKVADVFFFMEAGVDVWPLDMFEPLTFGFVFPFLSVKPWQRRGTPKMRSMARVLPKLLQTTDVVAGGVLRQFCEQNWKLCSMSESMVRRMLYFEKQ